jgi:hypothetical protein
MQLLRESRKTQCHGSILRRHWAHRELVGCADIDLKRQAISQVFPDALASPRMGASSPMAEIWSAGCARCESEMWSRPALSPPSTLAVSAELHVL